MNQQEMENAINELKSLVHALTQRVKELEQAKTTSK